MPQVANDIKCIISLIIKCSLNLLLDVFVMWALDFIYFLLFNWWLILLNSLSKLTMQLNFIQNNQSHKTQEQKAAMYSAGAGGF